MAFEGDLNLEATELRLGLPGTVDLEKQPSSKNNKRGLEESVGSGNEEFDVPSKSQKCNDDQNMSSKTTQQVVGWPPVRSYRKNCIQAKKPEPEAAGAYVKVSMDGVPYLRKIDVKVYKGYADLLKDLENMFKFRVGEYSEREGYNGSEFVPTYEDKDGDWMLVGDVPWNMFSSSCKRMRIMKGSEI